MIYVRITEPVYKAALNYLLPEDDPREKICFSYGHRFEHDGDSYLLFAEHPLLFEEDCYVSRSLGNAHLPKRIMDGVLLNFAASSAQVLANWHSHGFSHGGTQFSGTDNRDDQLLSRWLHGPFSRMLAKSPHIGSLRPFTSLALVVDHGGLAARICLPNGQFIAVDQLDIIGPYHQVLIPYNSTSSGHGALARIKEDRHRDFIPDVIHREITQMNVALIGCGGVGNLLAEALARLGIGCLYLIDPDRLDISNLNRWLGARASDAGTFKAELLAQRLSQQVQTGSRLIPLCTDFEHAARQIRACHLIVAAVDNDFTRLQINRFASQYLIPWYDAGTVITNSDDLGLDFRYRVLAHTPGSSSCIECSQFERIKNTDAILNDLADDALRAGRQAAGYVMDQPHIQAPSVLGLNYSVAGALMHELLNYLLAQRPAANQVYASWAKSKVERLGLDNFPEPPAASCPTCTLRLGCGDQEPILRSGRGRREIVEGLQDWRRRRHHQHALSLSPTSKRS